MFFTNVCHSFCSRGGGGLGFPACITGHMTRVVCIQRSSASGGSASEGGLGRPPEHYRIRSISGWYASFWKAFLFRILLFLSFRYGKINKALCFQYYYIYQLSFKNVPHFSMFQMKTRTQDPLRCLKLFKLAAAFFKFVT